MQCSTRQHQHNSACTPTVPPSLSLCTAGQLPHARTAPSKPCCETSKAQARTHHHAGKGFHCRHLCWHTHDGLGGEPQLLQCDVSQRPQLMRALVQEHQHIRLADHMTDAAQQEVGDGPATRRANCQESGRHRLNLTGEAPKRAGCGVMLCLGQLHVLQCVHTHAHAHAHVRVCRTHLMLLMPAAAAPLASSSLTSSIVSNTPTRWTTCGIRGGVFDPLCK